MFAEGDDWDHRIKQINSDGKIRIRKNPDFENSFYFNKQDYEDKIK